MDRRQRTEFKDRLLTRLNDWTRLNQFLGRRLESSGVDWKTPETWKEVWRDIQPLAVKVELEECSAIDLAETLWLKKAPNADPEDKKEPGPQQPEPQRRDIKEGPPDDLVKWVASLPDGLWDVVAWNKFVSARGPSVDLGLLQSQRDREIDHQYAAFEPVAVREDGSLWKNGKLRVKQFIEKLDDENSLELNRVPAGAFMMGSKDYFHEGPVHLAQIAEFYLGRKLVTQAQWLAVARLPKVSLDLVDNPAYFQGLSLPVDSVSWPEAIEFCARLATHTGRNYRLPTEAEWEYACRATSTSPFAFGETITTVIVNYDGASPFKIAEVGESRRSTVPTGSLGAANGFGLHDMHGNLWEWCEDEWHESYEGQAPVDGRAWVTNEGPAYRTLRGGSWCHSADACRSSERMKGQADETEKLYYIGFRVALSLPSQSA